MGSFDYWVGDALKYGFNFILQKDQTMHDLFTQALGIYSPWLVKNVEFNDKQLNIYSNYSAGVNILGSMPFSNNVNAVDALIPCFLQLDR